MTPRNWRRLITWDEATRAPWEVLLMFGGGLSLAMGMSASGLADWMGQMLLPLRAVPLLVVVGFVVLVTEFASNVAAASWGFMLPAGTGANALAWATGHIALPRLLKAGLLLDLAGVVLMVGVVWGAAGLA